MDGGNNLPEGEGGAARGASLGASKKQQRIVDLVKAQLHGQLKMELEQALEARLAQLTAPPGAQPVVGRPSRVVPPSGASAPAPDLRAEYQRRLRSLRPGDLGTVLELKREFRNKGLEVY